MAPRQEHELTSSTHSITALFVKVLSHKYPWPCWVEDSQHLNSSVRTFGEILSLCLFDLTIYTIISFQAILSSLQKQDHGQMYYFYCSITKLSFIDTFILINRYTINLDFFYWLIWEEHKDRSEMLSSCLFYWLYWICTKACDLRKIVKTRLGLEVKFKGRILQSLRFFPDPRATDDPNIHT